MCLTLFLSLHSPQKFQFQFLSHSQINSEAVSASLAFLDLKISNVTSFTNPTTVIIRNPSMKVCLGVQKRKAAGMLMLIYIARLNERLPPFLVCYQSFSFCGTVGALDPQRHSLCLCTMYKCLIPVPETHVPYTGIIWGNASPIRYLI